MELQGKDGQISLLTQQNKNLERNQKNLEKWRFENEEYMENVVAENNKLQEAITESERVRINYDYEIDGHLELIGELQEKNQSLSGKNSRLERENREEEENQNLIKNYELEIATKNREIKDLKNKNQQLTMENTSLQVTSRSRQNSVRNRTNSIESSKSKEGKELSKELTGAVKKRPSLEQKIIKMFSWSRRSSNASPKYFPDSPTNYFSSSSDHKDIDSDLSKSMESLLQTTSSIHELVGEESEENERIVTKLQDQIKDLEKRNCLLEEMNRESTKLGAEGNDPEPAPEACKNCPLLRQKIADLETQAQNFAKILTAKNQENKTAFPTDNKEQRCDFPEHPLEITALKAERVNFENDIWEKKKKIAELEKALENKQSEINKLSANKKTAEHINFSEREEEIRKLKNVLVDKEAEITALRGELSDKKYQGKGKKQDADSPCRQCEGLRQQLASLTSLYDKLKVEKKSIENFAENSKSDNKEHDLEEKLADNEVNLALILASSENKDKEIKKLEETLNEVIKTNNEEGEKYQTEIGNLRTKITELEKQINEQEKVNRPTPEDLEKIKTLEQQ
ncbi:3913_t:CDS:2, partial [Ambispora gerdemannii]